MIPANMSAAFSSGSFAAAIGLERACFFSVGGKVFAVEGSFVREVVSVTSPTPLPRTPPELSGVFAIRGDVWPLVSLGALFGLPVAPCDLAVLVVQGERRAALGLGSVLGFSPFDRGALEGVSTQEVAQADAATGPTPDAEQTFGLGVIKSGEQRALLLDVPALLEGLQRRLGTS